MLHNKSNPKLILYTAMLISFLGTLGIALPYPVLAPYFIDYPANNLTHFMGIHPKLLLGISLSIYPLGMLIGSVFIGALSDSYGRRRVLLITLFMTVVGYVLTAIAIYQESFVFFTIARFLTGLSEGNISIARAIVVDLHPVINRTRALSLTYAATYTGWMLGPVIGGFLMVFGVAEVFIMAGIGLLVSLILTWIFIERDQTLENEDNEFWYNIKNNNSLTLLKHKEVLPIFGFYFLYSMGLNAFYDFYPVWFVDYYHADGVTISMATISLTLVMIIFSSFIVTQVQQKLGEIRVIIMGSLVLSILLFVQPFLNLFQTFIIFAFIGASIAITNGMIPSYISTYFGHLGQGRVMGLQTSIFFITNVIIAVLGGPLSIIDSIWVLLLGALLIFLSCILLWKNRMSQYRLMSQSTHDE